ncbi:hypothetical protein PQU92_04720 [Asticcacaulis sp. BYS171W]|uniref:DUF2029 domain-containing protein n=1 Tax=Asticcacaulis aquaticus TaxID=2984212 RepID=A0ABT5HSX0_9CAUL|nr:glycosyltransferase 87 family protein [Asticcacaulis aquaticus]MDC7682566.1 hypothetical protein [Asticcacaulis aquaticus]
MDALTCLREKFGSGWKYGLFVTLCVFPVLAGVLEKFVRHRWVFMDVDAVVCAAQAVAAGQSPYAESLTCPGLTPAAFVYAPQIAQGLAPVVSALGVVAVRDIYLWALLLPATLFLLWYALFKVNETLPRHYRWLAFAALSPMTFCCANIGILMHALVLASLVLFRRHRWPFVLMVLACAYIKPTFLSYFVVLLMEKRPWTRSVRDFVLACGVGAGVVLLTFQGAGDGITDWMQALRSTAIKEQPGLGLFALLDWVGIETGSPLALAMGLAFTTAIVAAGVVIAHTGNRRREERLILGMGVAVLCNPRLMDYDMVLLVPYAALLGGTIGALKGRILRYNLSWGLVLLLFGGAPAYLFHINPYQRTHIAMFAFSVLTLVIGWRLWQMNSAVRSELRDYIQRLRAAAGRWTGYAEAKLGDAIAPSRNPEAE